MPVARVTLLLLTWLISLSAVACELPVAVAANFAAPMTEISERFSAQSGCQVRSTFAASGQLYAQIRAGAPYALLLSADQASVDKLIEDNLAAADTRTHYATGRLVLWSRDPAYLNDALSVLRGGTFRHLALANPRTAPYGLAAKQVLEHLGLTDALKSRLVEGQSITQAYQFVASGNAELGFVARSQVTRDGHLLRGSAWLVPASWHDPLTHEAVLLHGQGNRPEAMALLAFLQSDEARAIIARYGYEP